LDSSVATAQIVATAEDDSNGTSRVLMDEAVPLASTPTSVEAHATLPAGTPVLQTERIVFHARVAGRESAPRTGVQVKGKIRVDSTDKHTYKVGAQRLASNPTAHFVTAANQGDVVLTADVPTGSEITWGPTSEWTPLDATQLRVQRTTTGNAGIRVPVTLYWKGRVMDTATVWIVWAQPDPATFAVTSTYCDHHPCRTDSTGRIIVGTTFYHWAIASFRFRVEPSALVTNDETADVPELGGPRATAPPDLGAGAPGVRNPDGGVAPDGRLYKLSNGAEQRWDVTRQVRLKTTTILDVPIRLENADKFPFKAIDLIKDGDVAGNDDTDTCDECNDPYANNLEGIAPFCEEQNLCKKQHHQGHLESHDAPGFINLSASGTGTLDEPATFLSTRGEAGDRVHGTWQFAEFARLNLGTGDKAGWFRISDFAFWQFKFNVLKVQETNRDFNLDGDTDDILWTDNGGRARALTSSELDAEFQ
jgi:hypothetical protein